MFISKVVRRNIFLKKCLSERSFSNPLATLFLKNQIFLDPLKTFFFYKFPPVSPIHFKILVTKHFLKIHYSLVLGKCFLKYTRLVNTCIKYLFFFFFLMPCLRGLWKFIFEGSLKGIILKKIMSLEKTFYKKIFIWKVVWRKMFLRNVHLKGLRKIINFFF